MQRFIRKSRSLLITLILILALTPLSVLANEKKTNEIDYVALGDSLAAGVLSDGSVGKGYVDFIKEDLEAKGYNVNTVNKGVSGATTSHVLGGLNTVPELANADIITLSAGANDLLNKIEPTLQFLVQSRINPADLTPEKIAALQQTAITKAGEAELAKVATSNAISEAITSVESVQTAVNNVETAYESFSRTEKELLSLYPEIEVMDEINSIEGFIKNAKSSATTAVTNVNVAKTAFDSNAQVVAENLEATIINLSEVAQNLNSVVEKIEAIDSISPFLLTILTTTVKNNATEAIASIVNAKPKVETAIGANKEYKAAQETADAAQDAAQKAGEVAAALTKLKTEIETILQTISYNTSEILRTIRSVNPTAKIYVMGYYNALPYLPAEIQESITKPVLAQLNEAIAAPTAQFGATFIPVAHLFEGNYQTYLPNPENIHPSEAGYRALANGFMVEINKAFPVKKQNVNLGEKLTVNAGAKIFINGKNASLLLPDNLPTGTTLTVTAATEDALAKATAGNLKAFGDVLNFEFQYPAGFENYQGKFTLVLGYQADAPANVDIYYYNESTKKWESQKGNNHKESKTISLEVNHFSTYGVFSKVETPKTENENEDKDNTPVPGSKDNSTGTKNETTTTKNTKTNTLPNTATNHYNWILLGSSLIIFGVVMYMISRRKRITFER